MKIYVIRDELEPESGDLGWLFYDPVSERFFLELPEKKDPWLLPPPCNSFASRGIYSMTSEWAMRWVAQRIVPPDRQNLGMILKANGLKSYDPHKLLLLARGRCAQDDCYLTPVIEDALPDALKKRLSKKVQDVIPLSGSRMIVLFRDDTTRLIPLEKHLHSDPRFLPVVQSEDLFMKVQVTPLGNGIEWEETRGIPAEKLYRMGKKLPLLPDDFLQFTRTRILDTTGLAERMHCSRQYIKQLTDEGRLRPVCSGKNYTLFTSVPQLKDKSHPIASVPAESE